MREPRTLTVADLLAFLKDIPPETELWVQDVRDDNECLPIVNLPELTTIVKTTHHYLGGETNTLWVVNDPSFIRVEEEDIEASKQAVVWNE